MQRLVAAAEHAERALTYATGRTCGDMPTTPAKIKPHSTTRCSPCKRTILLSKASIGNLAERPPQASLKPNPKPHPDPISELGSDPVRTMLLSGASMGPAGSSVPSFANTMRCRSNIATSSARISSASRTIVLRWAAVSAIAACGRATVVWRVVRTEMLTPWRAAQPRYFGN